MTTSIDADKLKSIVSPSQMSSLNKLLPKNTESTFSSVISSDSMNRIATNTSTLGQSVIPQQTNLQLSTTNTRNLSPYQRRVLEEGVAKAERAKNERDLNDIGASQGYNTLGYSYPATGLGSERYPHFMMFFFNVNSKSTILENANTGATKGTVDLTANKAGQAVSDAMSAGGNKIVGAINGMDEGVTKTMIKSLGLDKFTSSRKRLSKAISLYMPNSIEFGHSVAYDAQSLLSPMAGAALHDAMNGQGAAALNTMGKHMMQTALGTATSIGAGLLKSGTGIDLTPEAEALKTLGMKASGLGFNNRQEQIFQNVNFRKFTFSWMMIPKNQEEADNIKQIIEEFKIQMHPGLNEKVGKSFLTLPAEVDIQFRYMNKENEFIPKIATCVIEAVNVNYTPISQWIAYSGTDVPFAVTLQLHLTETEPLFSEMFDSNNKKGRY